MKKIILIFLVLAGNILGQNSSIDPLSVARKIADRVINETTFELVTTEQKPALGLQVIDFNKAFEGKDVKYAYSFSSIKVNERMHLKFGISYSSPLEVWVNDKPVFRTDKRTELQFREIGYSVFSFQKTFRVNLNKGSNRIVVKSSLEGNPVIFIREITQGEENTNSTFEPLFKEPHSTWNWCFESAKEKYSEGISSYLPKSYLNRIYSGNQSLKDSLIFIKPCSIKKLASNPKAIYKKDQLADWNYFNGALMMTMMKLWKASGDEKYLRHVEKYCSFINENIPLFRRQYFEDHDLRTSYYRIFRKCMLDDAGAPALPFAEVEIENHTHDYDSLLSVMADYVLREQSRLPDGTLCRPDPVMSTVWADDLFMSVPLLVRMGALTNQRKYFDDAARQIVNFHKYLFDAKKKLYKHGWFSKTNQKSKIFWGRANGWIVWAESEALAYLPKTHPSYKKIENIFKTHLKGIMKNQDESGLWHQILDDTSSFEETSSSAMFIACIARAIRTGILDTTYSGNVFRAWRGLQSKVSNNGIVKDICCGTGIGMNAEFYKSRDRYENDPHGLGAVIIAAVEVSALQKFLDK